MQVLDRYFDALINHDWHGLGQTLSDDVHRTGPFLDVIEGKAAYLEFLSGIMPTLEDYALRILRARAIDEYAAVVELHESMKVDGRQTGYPEVLLFEFNEHGLICKVDIYIKQP